MKRILFLMLLLSLNLSAEFEIVILGNSGGVVAGTTTSYLIRDTQSKGYLALDAGSIVNGLDSALKKGNFKDISVPEDSKYTKLGYIFRDSIKGYFLSHAHMDHIAGLVISSTEDTRKNIYALPSVIDIMEKNVFNWKVWPNFGNDGEGFQLKKYDYVRAAPEQEIAIAGTPLFVTPFELCHSGVTSTAFLVRAEESYALYFGDTGPDDAEQCENLQHVWQTIAPLVRENKLRGIFLESSYADPREAKQLFGHLTPSWMMKELHRLAETVDPKQPSTALNGMLVMVTHIKPSLQADTPRRDQIKKQLEEANDLGVTFAFPEQGDRIEF